MGCRGHVTGEWAATGLSLGFAGMHGYQYKQHEYKKQERGSWLSSSLNLFARVFSPHRGPMLPSVRCRDEEIHEEHDVCASRDNA